MKVIAFLALLALTANAFNLTAYHLGVDAQLGFNDTEVQQGMECLSALNGTVGQIVEIIGTKNLENITEYLGVQIEQVKIDLETTCHSYFVDLGTYYLNHLGSDNITLLRETINNNFVLYYPEIVQQIAHWANLLAAGQDYQAGEIQSYIGQILNGVIVPTVIEVAAANTTVPLNTTKFYEEYLTTIFQGLGIEASVNTSALIECEYNLENVTATALYIQKNFSSFDFGEKLNAIQYIFSLGFETIRNCEGAAGVLAPIFEPQYAAFEQDPVGFTLEVANRIALDYPQYLASIQREVVDVQEGDYVAAGQEKLDRINNDFQGLVNYTSTN